MKVKFHRKVYNERWLKLSEEIGEMQDNPATRLCISRQPRTVDELTLKNKWAEMKKEQDGLEEFHEEDAFGEVIGTIALQDCAHFILAIDEEIKTIRVIECTLVKESKLK